MAQLMAISLSTFFLAYFGSSVVVAHASHREQNGTNNRVWSMEYGGSSLYQEDYCATIDTSSSKTLTQAMTALGTALSSGYQGLGSWKVKLVGQPNYQCQGGDDELRFIVGSDWDSTCGADPADNVSCAHASGTYVSHGNHFDYGYYNIYIRDNHLYNHAINHESGHALGMRDGTGAGDCTPASIMHSQSYGCSVSYSYPTSADQSSVTTATTGAD
jgi:hypothetical protein